MTLPVTGPIYNLFPSYTLSISAVCLVLAPFLHSYKANLLRLHFLPTLMEIILPHHCQMQQEIDSHVKKFLNGMCVFFKANLLLISIWE